ncbi:hypothetical protein FQN60_004463 [Etheostoma spectabile]|uniref:Uncharacterized protein n=1 Tax=Etheostoma spectabile TaxID=54343 RepID=A0A5J5CX93_9PERO|nr:hypothetical protein FQN60_004463 [Etheostoma spectabile]
MDGLEVGEAEESGSDREPSVQPSGGESGLRHRCRRWPGRGPSAGHIYYY